jgi:hypothetical protein
MWYLDDGLIRGTQEELAECITLLKAELAKVNLQLNLSKCELYGDAPPTNAALAGIPFARDREAWTFLGSSIGQNPGRCPSALAATKRTLDVNKAVSSFAEQYPAQALKIMRYCLGACRVTHLCQTAASAELREPVLLPVAGGLRHSLAQLLGHHVSDELWLHASLPARMGGLGLRDPNDCAEAARLAGLINAEPAIARLRVAEDVFDAAARKALAEFNARWGLQVEMPKASKDLQRNLTSLIYKKRRAEMLVSATPEDAERLTSLCSPHSTAWLTTSSPWFSLSAQEYRFALRWLLGVPVRPASYTCPTCGATADPQGRHAVACTLSGAASKGHTVVKRVLGDLFRLAGYEVDMEQGPKNSDERPRPADVLITGFRPKPLAVDTTIWSRLLYPTDPLDAVVEGKMAHHKPICAEMGWLVAIFAADVYGAMHPYAQQLMAKLALRVAAKGYLGDFKRDYSAAWSSISAAIVSRAASQLLRHALPDDNDEFFDEVLGSSPAGLPDPVNAPIAAPVSDAPEILMEEAADSSDVDHDHDDAVEEDGPASQEDQSPAVLQQATPMDAEETEEPAVTLAVRLPTGSILPVRVSRQYSTGCLLERLRTECGLPDSAQHRLGLALGFAALDLSRSLRENDVQEGDTLELVVSG